MSALGRGIVALVTAVIAPMTARAADVQVIRIFPPACEEAPVAVDDFIDSLRVELAGRQPHCCVVGPGGDAAADAIRVTLSIEPCDPATEPIGVAVELVAAQRTTERQVSLADLPREARPRALALAVAELIRSAGEPENPVVLPTPIPPPIENAAPPVALVGTAAGDVRRFFGQDSTLWGGRLGLSVWSGRWQATIDAGVARNETSTGAGDVSLLLVSAGLQAGPRFPIGPVVIGVGPTGALGWARIKGQPGTTNVVPGQGSGLVATAGVRAMVDGPAAHMFGLVGWLEAGMTARRLDADVFGQPVAGISGPYIMLAAGVKLGPG